MCVCAGCFSFLRHLELEVCTRKVDPGWGEIIIRLLHVALLFHEVTNQDLATRKGQWRETVFNSGTAQQINSKKRWKCQLSIMKLFLHLSKFVMDDNLFFGGLENKVMYNINSPGEEGTGNIFISLHCSCTLVRPTCLSWYLRAPSHFYKKEKSANKQNHHTHNHQEL